MTDVMIDIETMGQSSGAPIVQLGACYFNRYTGEIGDTFAANITLKSALESGAQADAGAIEFWLSTSDQARQSILAKPRQNLREAMGQFNGFLAPAKHIWSHATFDFVIVTNTLRRLDIKPHFKYQAARDIRTLTALAGVTKADLTGMIREGIHHNGLDDCKFQVKYCVVCFNKLAAKAAK
jgi:exodeoxyribonuclease VIII